MSSKESYSFSDVKLNHSLSKLININFGRGRLFSWAEMYGMLCDKAQQKSINRTKNDIIDPVWTITQSPKNLRTAYDGVRFGESIITRYSDPNQFAIKTNEYGVSNKIVVDRRKPYWLYQTFNKQWYWRQLLILKMIPHLYNIPGLLSIRITGSAAMRCSRVDSDVDIAIRTAPGFVYPTRMWLKFVVLKILRRDVHLFGVEMLLWMNKIARKLIPSLDQTLFFNIGEKLTNRIEKYKSNSKRIKIDAGIIYTKIQDLVDHYGLAERQRLWLWESSSIAKNSKHALELVRVGEKHILNIYTPQNSLGLLVGSVRKALVVLGWVLVYPLNLPQYWYYQLRHRKADNFIANRSIISFVPKIYKTTQNTESGQTFVRYK